MRKVPYTVQCSLYLYLYLSLSCTRAKIYQGKVDGDQPDMNQGPNAVLRNIDKVINGATKQLIITDRFYSSVLLSSILIQRQLYHVGTIRLDRLGYCKDIKHDAQRISRVEATG